MCCPPYSSQRRSPGPAPWAALKHLSAFPSLLPLFPQKGLPPRQRVWVSLGPEYAVGWQGAPTCQDLNLPTIEFGAEVCIWAPGPSPGPITGSLELTAVLQPLLLSIYW